MLYNLKSFGMGDLTDLAHQMNSGNINPTFSTNTFQPNYTPQGVLSTLPPDLYVDDNTAQQIAASLGGTVVKQIPESLNGTGVPPANFITLPNGQTVNAADIAQIAKSSVSIYGMSTDCGRQQQLSYVTGAALSSDCQSQQNNSPIAQQDQKMVNLDVASAGRGSASIRTPMVSSIVQTPVSATVQPSVVASQNVGASVNTTNTTQQQTISSSQNAINEAAAANTWIPGIPNLYVELGLAAVVVVYFMSQKHGR